MKYSKDFIMNHFKSWTSFKIDEKMFNDGEETIVGSIDICVSTKCNLRCIGCGSLMPLYDSPTDVPIDLLMKSLNVFFSVVDRVFRVNVVGGEPFLYKDLDAVIEYLNKNDKVTSVVLPSNGTYAPDNPKLYKALSHPKNSVRISHYESCEKGTEKLQAYLDEYNVDYSIKYFSATGYQWYDFGGYELRNRTSDELTKQYDNCEVEWMSVYRGKLYPCPRAAHAIDLGFMEENDNFVDLIGSNISLKELRENIQDFVYERKYYECCNHCDRGTGKCQVIQIAEQMK